MSKPSLKDINKWQQDSLTSFRTLLKSKSNLQALDKLEYLINGINDMYSDAIKYPQLKLPDYQLEQLERIIDMLNK